MMSQRLLERATALALAALALPAGAQTDTQSCSFADVRFIRQSARPIQDFGLDARQASIEAAEPKAGEEGVMMIARGPVLGSMDSEKLALELACTADGFMLTATITRSADYHGAVRQNVLWAPEVIVSVLPHKPAVAVQAIWNMRLSNGKALGRARTPPYLGQDYPITVRETLHPALSQGR